MTPTSNIVVSRATPSDYQSWAHMVSDYDFDISREQALDTWNNFFLSNSSKICLLATCGDKPIGFLHYLFHDFCFGHKVVCYISDLYVLPEFRRRGIARKLLQHVLALGRSSGWGRVYWVTESDNPARALYDEFGTPQFVRYHVDLVPEFVQQAQKEMEQ